MTREVLLFSGGLDSTALAAWRRPTETLTIDYGHKAADGEARAAKAIAKRLRLHWTHVRVDCSAVGSGLLAGNAPDPSAPSPEWWPFRNQLLVTVAAAWMLPRGTQSLTVGSVKTDSFHADGTEDFYQQIDALVRMQEGKIRVLAPALDMTTTELIKASGLTERLAVWTHSCHASDFACGACPGCFKRRRVISEVGWSI